MSDRLEDAAPLLRADSTSSGEADFRRNAPAQLTERPRDFKAHMGQAQASGATRLQELRKKHGWSRFRSSKSEGGRAYADALKAEKWRFLGGARYAQRSGPKSDAQLAANYRTGKQALKAGAGWRRFIPFSSTRSTYKDALSRWRTGNLQNENSLTSWDKLMGTKSAQRVMGANAPQRPAARPDADLQQVQALLGLGGASAATAAEPSDPAADRPVSDDVESSSSGASDKPSDHDIGFDELLSSDGADPGIGEQDHERLSQDDDDAIDAENSSRVNAAWDAVQGTSAFKNFMFGAGEDQEKPA